MGRVTVAGNSTFFTGSPPYSIRLCSWIELRLQRVGRKTEARRGYVWGRAPGDYGRVAYVTTDGGHAKPPADGMVRPAQVVRLVLGDETVPVA